MDAVRLVLYIADHAPSSTRAALGMPEEFDRKQWASVEMEVVDVVEEPQRAELARVVATPTLVRTSPLPERRIVGDLSDWARVVAGLGLDEEPGQTR